MELFFLLKNLLEPVSFTYPSGKNAHEGAFHPIQLDTSRWGGAVQGKNGIDAMMPI